MAENKTPTLYKLYDKEYSYDDLQRQADLGLNDYIMRLRRGEKDEQRFKDAYYNLMSGIKDGTITFDNGKYHDSKGRYFNGVYYDEEGNKQTSKKKTKDYYGLMANYIYNTQRGMNEYTKPEDPTKIKWNGNKSVGLALTRNIFNSDAFNYRTYLDSDVDSYDESTNKIGTKNRVTYLRNALQNTLNNFDNIFTGYTDNDKAKAVQYIQEAINSLNDGISPIDYLPLERAAGGLDYKKMFIDTYKPKQEIEQEQQEQEAQQQQQQLSPEQAFEQWAQTNHPIITEGFKSFDVTKFSGPKGSGKPYGSYTDKQIRSTLQNLSDDDLYNQFFDILYDNTYQFNNFLYGKNGINYHISNSTGIFYFLSELKRRNKLQEYNGEVYFTIPGAKKKSLRFGNDGKLYEISQWDNPFLAQQFINEYKQSNGGAYSDIYTKYISSQKNGGILKFQFGGVPTTDEERKRAEDLLLRGIVTGPTKYSSAISAIFYNDEDLLPNKRLRNIYNKETKKYSLGLRNGLKAIDTQAVGNGNYDPEEGNYDKDNKDLNLQNQSYYNPWISILTSNEKVAEQWAREYNNLNSTKGESYRKGWFRDDGSFDFDAFKKSSILWSDFKNGPGHDTYRGRAYKIKDTDEYYKEIPEGYEIVQGDPKTDSTGLVNVYELVKRNQDSKPTNQTPDDKTGGTDTTPRSENPLNRSKIPSILFEDLIETGRLFNSLRTNKKIYDTLRPSLKPALRDTYELYSPIIGAFSEMQLRNRQGADIQRRVQGPFTSDASLHLAGQLDANKQANELQYQGFIADDREIKRTAAEALKRQEDNKARRSEVANINRERINQVNRELAQLKAGKLQQDYTGVDNFMQYLKNRITAENERRRTFNLQSETTNIDNQYQDALYGIQERVNKWRAQNPDKDITSMDGYSDYLKTRRNLDNWRRAKYQEAYGNTYGYRYDSPYNYKTAEEIANYLRIAKKGGVLIPKLMK